jgi:thiamine biosynthesis lipoprotein
MRKPTPLIALTLACVTLPAGAHHDRGDQRPAAVWVEREAFVMGTRLRVVLAAPDRATGIAAIEAALAEVRAVEDVLSTWRADTELAALNRAPPRTWLPLSPRLHELLSQVRQWHVATGAAFDPAIGSLVDAWDLRGAGRIPRPAELAAARRAAGLQRFAFDDDRRVAMRTRDGAWIDAGAFGKGAALRRAWDRLAAGGAPNAMLDFGGQLLALGAPQGGGPWTVTVAHPARRSAAALRLRVRDRAVATTGQSERYVTVAGRRVGHVLDPRTGRPVPPWGSVTVVARDPLEADVLSTALFVMGPEAGLRWVRQRDDVGALFLIDREGELELRRNGAMEEYLMEENDHEG